MVAIIILCLGEQDKGYILLRTVLYPSSLAWKHRSVSTISIHSSPWKLFSVSLVVNRWLKKRLVMDFTEVLDQPSTTFSVLMNIFYKNLNLAQTFYTFYPPAAQGWYKNDQISRRGNFFARGWALMIQFFLTRPPLENIISRPWKVFVFVSYRCV